MKRLFTFLAIFALVTPCVTFTGCHTAPSHRPVPVMTLKVIGASADTAMKDAARLLKNDQISVEQWNRIAKFHKTIFQPSFNLAVAAVQSDLDSVASPDLLNLTTQLVALVASFNPQPISFK